MTKTTTINNYYPACEHKFIHSHETGDIICIKCGLVIEERVPELTSEFNAEYLKMISMTNVVIKKEDIGRSYHKMEKLLSYKREVDYNYIRTQRISKGKLLYNIQIIKKYYSGPVEGSFRDEMIYWIRKWQKKKRYKHGTYMILAIVATLAEERRYHIDLKGLCNVFNLSYRTLHKYIYEFQSEIFINENLKRKKEEDPYNAHAILQGFKNHYKKETNIDIPEYIITEALNTYVKFMNSNVFKKHTCRSYAAAILYIVGARRSELFAKSKRRFAQGLGISETTLRKILKTFEQLKRKKYQRHYNYS